MTERGPRASGTPRRSSRWRVGGSTSYGRCCVVEPRSRPDLRLDIFIEIPRWDRALEGRAAGRAQFASPARARQQGGVLAAVARHGATRPLPLGAQAYKGESQVLALISSTKTSRRVSSFCAIIACQAVLSHSSRSSAPALLFSAEAQSLQGPPDGGVAEGLAYETFQEVAPTGDGGRQAFPYVFFEELLGSLIYLRGAPESLPRGQGTPFLGHPSVALDPGEAHAEEASGSTVEVPRSMAFGYLAAEVFGVGSHPPVIAPGSIVLTNAVGESFGLERVAGAEEEPGIVCSTRANQRRAYDPL